MPAQPPQEETRAGEGGLPARAAGVMAEEATSLLEVCSALVN